jgi:hypothetical protein
MQVPGRSPGCPAASSFLHKHVVSAKRIRRRQVIGIGISRHASISSSGLPVDIDHSWRQNRIKPRLHRARTSNHARATTTHPARHELWMIRSHEIASHSSVVSMKEEWIYQPSGHQISSKMASVSPIYCHGKGLLQCGRNPLVWP